MNDPRLSLYERYLTAWSPVSPMERRGVLGETVVDDLPYRDAMARLDGAEALARHLDEFQRRQPGGAFRLVSLLAWGSDALARWQFVDAAGEPGFAGYDALTFAPDGRIASIVGFSDVDKYRLR